MLKDIILLAIKVEAFDRSIKIEAFDRAHGKAEHILRTQKCQTLLPKGLSIKERNTSLAAPGALANRLQRRTARKANEANLDPPNQKSEITSL